MRHYTTLHHYITPLHYTIIYITPLHYTTFYILHYISSYYITFHNNTSLEFIRYFCSHEPRSYGEHPSSSPEACDTSPGDTAPGYLHRPFDQDSVSNAKVLQGSKLPPLGITKYPALVWPYGACSCFGTNPYISLCIYIYIHTYLYKHTCSCFGTNPYISLCIYIYIHIYINKLAPVLGLTHTYTYNIYTRYIYIYIKLCVFVCIPLGWIHIH